MKIVLSDNENGMDGLVLSMMGMRYYYELINKPIFAYDIIYDDTYNEIDQRLINFDDLTEYERITYCSTNPYDPLSIIYDNCFDRDDPILIKVVEELGPILSSSNGRLRIVEIPDDVEYRIEFENDWAGGPEYAEEKFPKPREWR